MVRQEPARPRRITPTAARQPSNNTAVTDAATNTKLAATPAEVALRSSMPTATVHSQTTTPVGTTAVGRRQPRDASHPTAVPDKNGHAVVATPETLSPSSWLRRPRAQNTSTATTSMASHAGRCMQRDYRPGRTVDPAAAVNLRSSLMNAHSQGRLALVTGAGSGIGTASFITGQVIGVSGGLTMAG